MGANLTAFSRAATSSARLDILVGVQRNTDRGRNALSSPLRHPCGRRIFPDDHAALGMCVWGSPTVEFRDRGDNGIVLPPRPEFASSSRRRHLLYLVFVFCRLAVMLTILVKSPFGRSLVASRERIEMRILGYQHLAA